MSGPNKNVLAISDDFISFIFILLCDVARRKTPTQQAVRMREDRTHSSNVEAVPIRTVAEQWRATERSVSADWDSNARLTVTGLLMEGVANCRDVFSRSVLRVLNDTALAAPLRAES